MALTDNDIKTIKTIITNATSNLVSKDDLNHVEARLVSSTGLFERDAFSRLDDHETRITNLERQRASA